MRKVTELPEETVVRTTRHVERDVRDPEPQQMVPPPRGPIPPRGDYYSGNARSAPTTMSPGSNVLWNIVLALLIVLILIATVGLAGYLYHTTFKSVATDTYLPKNEQRVDNPVRPPASVPQQTVVDSAPDWLVQKCAAAGHPAPTKSERGTWDCFTPLKLTPTANAPYVPGLSAATTVEEAAEACIRAGYRMTKTPQGKHFCDTSKLVARR